MDDGYQHLPSYMHKVRYCIKKAPFKRMSEMAGKPFVRELDW